MISWYISLNNIIQNIIKWYHSIYHSRKLDDFWQQCKHNTAAARASGQLGHRVLCYSWKSWNQRRRHFIDCSLKLCEHCQRLQGLSAFTRVALLFGQIKSTFCANIYKNSSSEFIFSFLPNFSFKMWNKIPIQNLELTSAIKHWSFPTLPY